SSGPPVSRCCCGCPVWTATVKGHGSRMGRHSPATEPRRCETPSPTIITLPDQLRRSLTWDQGAEMAEHAQLRFATDSPSISATPNRRGSVAPTRTPTAGCANTSHRAPTSPGTPQTTSTLLLSPSTPGPERPSDGGHPPKP